ncbi:hypothetical protein EDD22DRAFT_978791 [Suillus occidentalis]|nr:hypothetical protein EDD22DRAFT_978791 [Suillus occidentalis]
MVYHPSVCREPLLQTFEEFGVNSCPEEELPIDEEPWRPFCSHGDFEFAEITPNAALNKSHIDVLLALIGCISRGESQVTFANDNDLRKAWEHTTAQVMPFVKHDITTHALPLWDWALNLLANLLLAPHFVWDAQRVFKHNGREFEQFYNEPWTGTRLPNDIKAAPFCFILYVDKTRLSSHGTVKGYPVVVHCTNLPVGIRNREGIGGGRVVGWLPIVSEDADEEGKPGFVNLKCIIWHEAFLKLLELVVQHSKSGYSHTCYDKIMHWLFPIILILSADYEEQCMMSLICGHHSKCPCPVCLVPLEELSELSKTFAFRSVEEAIAALNVYKVSKARGEELLKALGLRTVANVFWLIAHSDPHQAISFDRLHALHLGMWRHLLEELKKILKALGHDEESKVEKRVASFPQWHNLNHFSTVIHITFSDGNKMQDLSKQAFYAAVTVLNQRTSPEGYKLLRVISSYLQLDSYIGLDVHTSSMLAAINAELLIFDSALKVNVLFIHFVNRLMITHSRTTSNVLSILPSKVLSLTGTFQRLISGSTATRDIQMKGAVCNYSTHLNEKLHGPLKEAYEHQSNGKDVADQILHVDKRTFAVKMLRAHMDVLDNWHTLVEEGDDDDEVPNPVAFEGYIKLGSTQQPVTLPTNFLIHEHHSLKVHYESAIDWKQTTDYLRCTPCFHGQLRYDCALIQLTQEVSVFVRLVFIFSCQLLDVGSFKFALVQPFTAGIGASRKLDRDLRLTHIKAVPRASSIFVPVQSFIHGAVCFPDPDHQDEFLMVDHIDSDMFVHLKSHPACQ